MRTPFPRNLVHMAHSASPRELLLEESALRGRRLLFCVRLELLARHPHQAKTKCRIIFSVREKAIIYYIFDPNKHLENRMLVRRW